MPSNLVVLRFAGDATWQRLSSTPLVLSGTMSVQGTVQIRVNGGPGVMLQASIPYRFKRVDLSKIEFYAAVGAHYLTVFAGSWD